MSGAAPGAATPDDHRTDDAPRVSCSGYRGADEITAFQQVADVLLLEWERQLQLAADGRSDFQLGADWLRARQILLAEALREYPNGAELADWLDRVYRPAAEALRGSA